MNNNNNENSNENMMNISNHSPSILLAGAVLRTPAQKRQPATSSALYKLAARNLREYHGVPSMTALKLEKTVALLGLAPRRILVQGLAPRRLLKGGKGGSSPMVLAGDSSDEGKEELREAEAGALVDENLVIINNNNNNNNTSSSEDEEEEEEEEVGQEDILFSDDSNSTYDDNGDSIDDIADDTQDDIKADGNGYGKKNRRPIHAALVAGGISLHPRETRPLLCALGVSPRRLVKLGLVKREAIRTMAGGRGGRGQHLRTGGPGKGGVGGPRGLSRGPPHSLGGPSSRCGPFRPMQHGPRRRLVHGAGRHIKHVRGEESGEEEGMPAHLGPGPHAGPEHHGPRHHGRRLQGPPYGPGHHSMPTGRHGRGSPAGGKHGHGHRHPPNGHGLGHDDGGLHGEGEEEAEGERLYASARGPGHRGPRHRGREGMGRSRGRPQGPPHGPPDGPFHGLFHEEGAPGAPPGMMAHPRHGSPSRGGCGMKQHGGRHGGGKRFCGGGGRGGGGGGGGGAMRHGRMGHLAHGDGRQQPQLEAY